MYLYNARVVYYERARVVPRWTEAGGRKEWRYPGGGYLG